MKGVGQRTLGGMPSRGVAAGRHVFEPKTCRPVSLELEQLLTVARDGGDSMPSG